MRLDGAQTCRPLGDPTREGSAANLARLRESGGRAERGALGHVGVSTAPLPCCTPRGCEGRLAGRGE